MPESMSGPGAAGVVNPYALVEVKLGRKVDWPNVANRKRFIEAVLNFPFDNLFDPRHGSPLYPGQRFDIHTRKMVRDHDHAPLTNALNRLQHLNVHVLGAGAAGGTSQQWVDPGVFFTNSADFTAPVQGALPNCHFISAMAALAWADPFAILHATRPINNFVDALVSGGANDRIFFYSGTGAAAT